MAVVPFSFDLKLFLVFIWETFKAAFAFGQWEVLPHDDSGYGPPAETDLESGMTPHAKRIQPLRFVCVIGQILFDSRRIIFGIKPMDGVVTSTGSIFATRKDNLRETVFVDLSALKTRCRLKLLAGGQRYASLPSTAIKRKRRTCLTGKQLGVYMVPPEPRGEDLRKWILIMETLFPNRLAFTRLSDNRLLGPAWLGVNRTAVPGLSSTTSASNLGCVESQAKSRYSRLRFGNRHHIRSVHSSSALNNAWIHPPSRFLSSESSLPSNVSSTSSPSPHSPRCTTRNRSLSYPLISLPPPSSIDVSGKIYSSIHNL